jgi:hypothetical protein
MSPAICWMPRPCTRRSSSHSRSATSLGSPRPRMYRLPYRVPSRTAPSTYTGVAQVKAGPSSSSPAKVVTSFMTDAGLTGTPVRWARRGASLPSTSATSSVTASRGILARARAASTSGGRAWAKAWPSAMSGRAVKPARGGMSCADYQGALQGLDNRPMKVLAFDTSTEALSVAVGRWQGGALQLWQHTGPGGAQASATLIPCAMALAGPGRHHAPGA